MNATNSISPEQLARLAGEDQGPLTKNIIVTFTIIGLISICLRLYTRLRYKAVGREDYSIIVAMVCLSEIHIKSTTDAIPCLRFSL
jgi:hypothetical protein